uniref:NADH-ubiquinone oxidoreductase chain 2 n=1 Tax=Ghauriana sinensis TaxID=2729071 RepID=A0A6M3R9V6_9HEMI|nr:NADH dehydrogenase subunit 2 [Ghauriana sinensis]
MVKNSSMFLFMFFMLIGILISISSNNWILIWCGLEVSLICFIPLMLNKNYISSECSMKYFIIQSISSSILVLSFLFMLMNVNFNFELLLIISMMIKMGVAPFHNWVLNVIDGLDFFFLFILLTLLKIPPLCILTYISLYLNIFVLMSLIIGSISGLNQNSSIKILGYSSIFNMGFILSCLCINQIWLFYMLFYSLLIFMFIYLLKSMNLMYINQMIMNDFSINMKFIFFINLLSMGGMPPLLGFMIKLIILEFMFMYKLYFLSFVMIMMSLIVMYFYIRLSFVSVMMYTFMLKNMLYNINFNSLIILMLNLLLLPILFFMKFMF